MNGVRVLILLAWVILAGCHSADSAAASERSHCDQCSSTRQHARLRIVELMRNWSDELLFVGLMQGHLDGYDPDSRLREEVSELVADPMVMEEVLVNWISPTSERIQSYGDKSPIILLHILVSYQLRYQVGTEDLQEQMWSTWVVENPKLRWQYGTLTGYRAEVNWVVKEGG